MRGFSRRATVEQVLDWLDGHLQACPAESVPLREAAGRVLATDVVSLVSVPAFPRAMMDGFAVRAAETLGAAIYNPLSLRLVGESWPGVPFAGTLQSGQAVRIMTGAPLPEGADAVLPAELSQLAAHARGPLAEVTAVGEVSPGKHVGQIGEDITAGSCVLPRGRRLRPQDVGILSSIGVSAAPVVARPSVRLVVTGNELLPPGSPPRPFHIADANGPMLHGLVRRDGGKVLDRGIVADDPQAILAALRDKEADVVLVAGGSSVGQEDHAPRVLARHGELAYHGIAMRPSSPAGVGGLDGRLVFLLPGNPVSCLCAYDFFAGRAIRAAGGRDRQWPYPRRRLVLARKISSVIGRVDYARVSISDERVVPLAIGGASVLSSTSRADGFVIVPADSEGHPSGAEVDVFFYDL
jgi:molybdopterin molybdotransferase